MKKIIVAEDDKFLANAYRVKLAKAGLEVRMASDGQEVIDLLNKGFIPDLLILDLVMPNLDGFGVLAKLKANPAWAKLPCIVASNLGQKEDIDRAQSLGATDYIIKTDLSLSALIEKIKKMVGE